MFERLSVAAAAAVTSPPIGRGRRARGGVAVGRRFSLFLQSSGTCIISTFERPVPPVRNGRWAVRATACPPPIPPPPPRIPRPRFPPLASLTYYSEMPTRIVYSAGRRSVDGRASHAAFARPGQSVLGVRVQIVAAMTTFQTRSS